MHAIEITNRLSNGLYFLRLYISWGSWLYLRLSRLSMTLLSSAFPFSTTVMLLPTCSIRTKPLGGWWGMWRGLRSQPQVKSSQLPTWISACLNLVAKLYIQAPQFSCKEPGQRTHLKGGSRASWFSVRLLVGGQNSSKPNGYLLVVLIFKNLTVLVNFWSI